MHIQQQIEFNKTLLERYNTTGPRYTSYPTVPQFSDSFNMKNYKDNVVNSNSDFIPKPLSLYFHIPFCDTICYYCACNKIITKNHDKAETYLDYLITELKLQAQLFDADRIVEQLHWGGGTPTFLSHEQMTTLMSATRENFKLRDDDEAEYSIEIDPRKASTETIALLRNLGFNRISLGVQDFSKKVQNAVNRIQPESETSLIIAAAKENKFKSINIDLIYGLPFQTVTSFKDTIDKVIQYSPDRIAIYNYAHLPQLFKPQRRISERDLPSPNEKLAILQMVIETLTSAGYVYIGMDHFAKPQDELSIAQRNKGLHRNFQGYSSHQECDMVAMGVTAISKVEDCFSQNVKTLDAYYEKLDQQQLPILKGYELNFDDELRSDIIAEITCYSQLDINKIEKDFGIIFNDYFSNIKDKLLQLESDGLITRKNKIITVTLAGRLLLRNIAMVFDKYLPMDSNNVTSINSKSGDNQKHPNFSRLI
ncbi:Coproporphyrinogen III oxidase, oxygen-independent [hydrothermal vent metagenome]|uniref:coproporphyrinogen dehydrogenase n=1 Tax=hydrothermal vent metagenome TaxID=652676 RepID=A0A3B1A181_9ZZZZ